jgi:SpoVK/Ycf46/Vps4 family AAA+-type ATPase
MLLNLNSEFAIKIMPVADKNLIRLLEAHRDGNDSAFRRAAEAIIAEELTANHHGFAKELKKALGNGHTEKLARHSDLMVLPKDRRDGEELVRLQKSVVDSTKIVLAEETSGKIRRALEEHRNRNQLTSYGYQPKAKLLFWGAPGCGKTYTAFYLAHELGLPVGVIRLNALVSSFLGDTASHLQKIFDFASSTPMVLLLDEADAIGKERDDRNEVGELKRVVNSLLQALDTFTPGASIVIAASNHQYLLDEALWRRFDDIVNFPLPGEAERELYLSRLLNGVEFSGSLTTLSRKMNTFSFADIKRVIVEAVKTMILEGRGSLHYKDVAMQIHTYKKDLAHAKAGPRKGRKQTQSES